MAKTQSGTITLQVLHGQTAEATVIFSKAFANKPSVVCSLSDTGPGQDVAYLSCMALEVSKTGFTAKIKRFIGNPNTGSSDIQVEYYWLAKHD